MSRPTLPMIILGRTLLRLRLEAGLTQKQAAKASRFSEGKLSSIENGKQAIKLYDVAGLCRLYGAAKDLEDELIRMSDKVDEPGWWESYTTAILKDFSVLLELEAVCRSLYQYEGELIPGLLQTEAYAHAIHRRYPLVDAAMSREVVALRLERQRRFWSRDPMPEVCFIMHESAIRRPICGNDGDTEQRARLLEMAQRADIRVVPYSAGAHPSMKGSYLILESGLEDISDVVYMETVHGCTYEEDESALRVYRMFFTATRDQSVPIGEILR